MSIRFFAALACVVSLPFAADLAGAQSAFFPVDTTLDASNPVVNDAYVGYADFNDYLNEQNGTNPTVTMVAGASIGGNMQTFNASVLNVTAGTIGASFGSLLVYDQSTVNMSGGIVEQEVNTQTQSTFNFSGGTIGDDFTTVDSSIAHISGGTIGHSLLTNSQSVVTISGGTVVSDIFVQDASSLTMFGNLTDVVTDPNYEGFYTEYTLTGHLVDGTDISGRTVFVQNGSGAEFALSTSAVPEPASGVLIGAGLVGLLLWNRRGAS